ncbi:MAG: FliI/YscN family ATPase [Myxococcota bacterium]
MSAVNADFVGRCRRRVERFAPYVATGEVRSCVGTTIEGAGLCLPVGAVCRIGTARGEGPGVLAEVVGFREDRFLLMPLQSGEAISPGAPIRIERRAATAPAGQACLGRVLDGLGVPIDGRGPLARPLRVPLHAEPAPPLERDPIAEPIDLGVRSLNTFTTAGRGMRLGIFAGSGVGKSTLMGQVSRFTDAEVAVIALIGERGREVREFLERDLGDALDRSVVVVATSDEAPLMRVRAANTATAIAEQFRREGRHVLLMMDSLTRFCFAMREIGLAAGEPPTQRGYTPSVWSALPKLVERAGTATGSGSITGIYTVLVEGDDNNEPVADAARSVLDGHVVLSREIAERGQFPAVDVLASVSRVMSAVVPREHVALARKGRELLATHRRAEDLIAIGAYVAGSDPAVDEAQQRIGALRGLLEQAPDEACSLGESRLQLARVLGVGEEAA